MAGQGHHTGTSVARQMPGDVQVISMDFRDVLAGIWRRRLAVMVTGLVCAGIAYGVATTSSAKYTTNARILVDNLETPFNRVQPNEGASDRRQVEALDILSQVEVVQSRDVAKRVIDQLQLVQVPEFNPNPANMGPIKKILVATGFSADPGKQTPEQRALAAYDRKVNAYQIPQSKVIVVETSSSDPQLAAALANSTVETYVQMTREYQSEATGRARKWLSEQIEDLRKKVIASEAAAEEYRARAGLLKGQNAATLNSQELSELSTQIVLAQTQHSEAQSKARAIRDLLARTGTVDTSIDVLNSPLIQRLREQQIALKRSLAELSTVYLDNHPRIIGVKSELADLDRQLRSEALKIVRSLEQEAKVAATREAAMRESLAALKSKASFDNLDEVKLRALEREATANRTLLEAFLVRFSDASTRQELDAQPGLARVIARADPPSQPSFPRVGPIVVIGLVGGLILGLGFAFMAEVMSAANRVFAPASKAPGSIAVTTLHDEFSLSGEESSADGPAANVAATPAEPLLPAIDAGIEEPTGIGLAASPDPATALMPVAAWLVLQHHSVGMQRYALVSDSSTAGVAADAAMKLARLVAGEGLRVIVIDADTRNRPLATLFGITPTHGLVDLLAGKASFSDVITRDPLSPVHVLAAGARSIAGPDTLSGMRVEVIHEALGDAYDMLLVLVGRADEASLAPGGMAANCQGALVFAPGGRSQKGAAIVARLHQLGLEKTRLVKVAAPKEAEARPAMAAASA